MLLSEVIRGLNTLEVTGGDPDVQGVTHDSRRVGEGFVFVCLVGASVDGHDFADGAVRAGASALLVERTLPIAVAQVVVPDTRTAMARAAANFWRNPSRDLTMVGVTGTNGKTTTVAMVNAILDANDIRSTPLGTLSAHIPNTPPTTPDSTDLQALLASLRDDGYAAVAMEVSSEALIARRVDSIVYDVAGFTNLSQDHLNVHRTMENYFAAKAMLFTRERARTAVVCVDDDWGSRMAGLAEQNGLEVVRVSRRDIAVQGSDIRWNGATGVLNLAGQHNVANAAVAVNIGEVLGLSPQAVLDGLSSLQSVPGRFEYVDMGQPFAVVVDYAHTPDGVDVVLRAARDTVGQDGEVTVVVGCGGDRDRAKRPLMASVAEALADRVVLTSDNPRSEDPRAILEEMQTGLRDPSRVITDPDRAAAIRVAIEGAAPGGIVVIAGKGHETTQTIGDEVIPFDDREVARAVLAELGR